MTLSPLRTLRVNFFEPRLVLYDMMIGSSVAYIMGAVGL